MRHLQTKVSKESKRGFVPGRTGFTYVVIDPELAASRWISLGPRETHQTRHNDNYLRQVIEACSANVVAFNEAAKVVHANQSWRTFAVANGLSSDDHSLGLSSLRRSQERTNSSNRSSIRFLDDVQRLINTNQQNFEREYVFKGSKGQRTLVIKASRVDKQNAAERDVRILATLEDVTQHRTAEDELRNLSGRLINAQEQERSRVARELHDHVNQRLAVLSIELEQLRRKIPDHQSALGSTVRSVLSLTRELAFDIHRLSYQLHPFKLDHLGLGAALKALCDEFASHHEMRISFRPKGSATMPSDITLCLFRIAQESLNNVVKHSGAREASVMLTTTEDRVRLRVLDRGCGFDVESAKVRERFGLTSMRERLRLVGGEISIQSQLGRGTKVDALIPLLMESSEVTP